MIAATLYQENTDSKRTSSKVGRFAIPYRIPNIVFLDMPIIYLFTEWKRWCNKNIDVQFSGHDVFQE